MRLNKKIMKNKEQLKNAFERFPKVDVLFSDGERIYAKPTEGANKVTRSDVFDAEVKANAEVKAKADSKKAKTKTE